MLLAKRGEISRIAALCNIPVVIWLWWGDEYVPPRQTLRALSTWAGTEKAPAGARQAGQPNGLVEHYSQMNRDGAATEPTTQTSGREGLPAAPSMLRRFGPPSTTSSSRPGAPSHTAAHDGRGLRLPHRSTVDSDSVAPRPKSRAVGPRLGPHPIPGHPTRKYEDPSSKLVEADPEGAAKLLATSKSGDILLPGEPPSRSPTRPASTPSPCSASTSSGSNAADKKQADNTKPPRPQPRPGGAAHGKESSACATNLANHSVASPATPASASLRATASAFISAMADSTSSTAAPASDANASTAA